MQGKIGRSGSHGAKRTLGVQAALEWAFRVEQAQLELPLPKDGVEEGKLKSEDVKEELSLKGVAQAERSAPEAAVVVSFGGSDDGGGSVDVASVASAGKGYIARAGGRWRKGGR